MPSPRELLVCLLDYIKEQAKDINPRAYTLSSHKGFLRPRKSLLGLPGVEFDIRVLGDHVWLRIPRLAAVLPPDVPPQCKGILRVSSDPKGSIPTLDESAYQRRFALAAQELRTKGAANYDDGSRWKEEDQKAIAEALEQYVAVWKIWASQEAPRRDTIALYGDLFALMHQLEAEETNKPQELVWGLGISTWQFRDGGQSVSFDYPLLSQAMEIAIDEDTMAIELRPRATNTHVELDAFMACQIRGSIEVDRAVQAQLTKQGNTPVSPFDVSSYSDVLKLVATNLDSEGSYREVTTPNEAVPRPGTNLVVTDDWALLSRPRSINYLFEDLARLRKKLEDGCTIHSGPLALVTEASDQVVEFEAIRFRGLSSRGSTGTGKTEELYFPLPYNDEQVTIIQRLERACGVTVQGPPGTGKTHTIANVICHYLATGKRVLVTSRGEAALSVLQEKLPEEIRRLTVSLLSSDREGIRQFQGAIEAIQHQVSQINPQLLRQEIKTLEDSVDRAHAELIAIDRRVDAIAIQHLKEIGVDGAQMRAQELAELVVSGESRFGWFTDSLTLEADKAPPLSDDEASQLRDARRKLGSDIVYVETSVPSPNSLPDALVIGELHEILIKKQKIEDDIRSGRVFAFRSYSPLTVDLANALLDHTDLMIKCVAELEEIGQPWPFELR